MTPSLKPTNLFARLRKWPRWSWALVLVAAGALLWFWFRGASHSEAESATFAARRGPLNITVLEGGSVKAVESQEIKCEVRVGYQGLKILKIVEEGYEVTPRTFGPTRCWSNLTPRICKSRSCSRTFNSSPPPPASLTRNRTTKSS